jgi:Icc-related predicted phosphoesterase
LYLAMTEMMRVAAVGDIHCSKTSQGVLQPMFAQMAECADVIALCGDLCDYGLLEEAQLLVKEMADALKANIPIVAVLGNHDFESGQPDVVKHVLTEAGVKVLDGDAVEIDGIGFAGTKGFCGGFGRRGLEPWGEKVVKAFVREALDEALKLELALAHLRTPRRVAMLHYAPIEATVVGEPLEIYPFLGSSRLEDPVNRYEVDVVIHGHAHKGTLEGKTSLGIPVYNVSMPLLRRSFPDRPAFRILELERTVTSPSTNGQAVHAEAMVNRIG